MIPNAAGIELGGPLKLEVCRCERTQLDIGFAELIVGIGEVIVEPDGSGERCDGFVQLAFRLERQAALKVLLLLQVGVTQPDVQTTRSAAALIAGSRL
jgi:hypothetical protein